MQNPPISRPDHRRRVDLCRYDGASIAVAFPANTELDLFRGRAAYQYDRDLGRVLVVTNESASERVIIAEEYWTGQIVADVEDGCQYLFILSPTPQPRFS